MASPVTAKLTKLSNQYSAKVKRIRELEALLKKPFVSDPDAKRMNEELNKLNGEIKNDFDELTKLTKLEKTAKDYTSLQTKIKEKQLAIAKAEARGEDTSQLKADQKDLTDKFNSIAPDVEKGFPSIKAKPVKETKPGPMGNVQMTTGTTVAGTTASKADAVKPKVTTPVVDDQGKLPLKKTKVV
jgi:hypothetical protein